MIGGRLHPVVDLIGESTAAYSLKCRFPRETGQSQAPRRQQDYTKHGKTHGRHNQPSPGSKLTAESFLELKSVQGGAQISQHENIDTSRSSSNADSGSLMGSKRKC
ncbi:hypothetical protein F511_40545 [Dorcoceras hygrometricum]|uniref:Uncharacterized protein n=1 Tax=Dorcoceras hygrometricum TaxID=472368 RepID=A0A2Z7CQ66_9LAMI|nr:hypothetical protein F511_40545 [Dorcoceras hygrometricum]